MRAQSLLDRLSEDGIDSLRFSNKNFRRDRIGLERVWSVVRCEYGDYVLDNLRRTCALCVPWGSTSHVIHLGMDLSAKKSVKVEKKKRIDGFSSSNLLEENPFFFFSKISV